MDEELERRLREVWPNLSQAEIDNIHLLHEGRWPKRKPKKLPRETRQEQAERMQRQEERDKAQARIDELLASVRAKSLVYFIQNSYGGPVKIGLTANGVERRLAELQTGNPNALSVLNSLHGSEADERRLHSLVSKHRIQGEWFKPEPVVLRVAMARTITEAIAIAERG